MSEAWVNWVILAFCAVLLGAVVWFAVRGRVKYPKEWGKGGFPFDNQVPGLPPMTFDRDTSRNPDVPRLVVPSDKSQ